MDPSTCISAHHKMAPARRGLALDDRAEIQRVKGMGIDCGITRLQKIFLRRAPKLRSIFSLSFIMEC